MTVSQLYDKGIQWFEPLAKNYIPLKSTETELQRSSGVLHTSFKKIVDWTTESNKGAITYSGVFGTDWKGSSTGGNGFKLAEINGMPYWTDALGQIPFAIDSYEYYLRSSYGNTENGNPTPDYWTVQTGVDFSNGLPYVESDHSTSYDNLMIIRATEWAHKYMNKPSSSKDNNFKSNTRGINIFSDKLEAPTNKQQLKKYESIIFD